MITIQYKFPTSWIGDVTLRDGIGEDATVLDSFTVDSTRAVQRAIEQPASGSALWFRRESDGELLPAGVYEDSGGSGAYLVTRTITDGTNPLASAKMRVSKPGLSLVRESDGEGRVAFALDAGTYSYTVTASGFAGATGTLTITGDSTVGEIVLAETAIVVVGDPAKVPVYGYAKDFPGAAVAGAIITIAYTDGNVVADDAFVVTSGVTAIADADGFFEFDGGLIPSRLLSPAKPGHSTHRITITDAQGDNERKYNCRISDSGGNLATMLVR